MPKVVCKLCGSDLVVVYEVRKSNKGEKEYHIYCYNCYRVGWIGEEKINVD